MKPKMMLILLLAVLLIFACQKKNSTEPSDKNIHLQQDIPWPSLADSPWPMAHGDAQCTGRSKEEGPIKGNVSWIFSEDGFRNEISGVVVGEDGTIYFSGKTESSQDYNRYLYALKPDGSLKWKLKLEGIQASTPLIDNTGIIYVASASGPVYAVFPDGKIKWEYETGTLVYTFGMSIGLDNAIYFCDTEGTLFCLNSNGNLNWAARGRAGLYSGLSTHSIAMSPDGSVLYLGGLDSTLNAISSHNGELIWQIPIGYQLITSPLIDSEGNIYFIKKDSTFVLCSVTPEKHVRWQSDQYVHPYIGLHIDKDGNIYAYGGKNQLLSFDYEGNLRWAKEMLSAAISVGTNSIIGDSKGRIYFAYDYRYVVALDQSGNKIFTCELPDLSDGLIMGAITSSKKLIVSGSYQVLCIE